MGPPRLKDARSRREGNEAIVRAKRRALQQRSKHAARREILEARLVELWGPAFELFEDVLLECRALGTTVAGKRSQAAPAAVKRTHLSLNARALLAGSEILVLLRSGHGHGALARWRTLFELSTTAEFIKVRGSDAATRYVEYYPVDARRELLGRYPELKGDNALQVPSEVRAVHAELNQECARLEAKYGRRFVADMGWAERWFPGKGVKFKDLMTTVEIAGATNQYRLASYYVHASGRGALDHFRLEDSSEVLLSTPSDELISRPGRLGAITLALISSMLVDACKAGRAAATRVWAIATLASEAEEAFRQGHRRWVVETGQGNSAWLE